MKTIQETIKKEKKNRLARSEPLALPCMFSPDKQYPTAKQSTTDNLQQSTSGARTGDAECKVPVLTRSTPHAKQGNTDTDDLSNLEPITDNLPDIIPVSDNPESIWRQERFPHNTKPVNFTPVKLKRALIDYAHNIIPIDKLLKSRHIKPETFWHLVRVYGEISEFYLAAQHLKARKYGEAAQDLFELLPENDAFYTYDRAGNRCLTTAGVRYLEVKASQLHRFAQIHETGSYIPVSKQETTNRNLTLGVQLHGKLPNNFDIGSAGPDAIINALRTGKKC